jgi:hypothetical protein
VLVAQRPFIHLNTRFILSGSFSAIYAVLAFASALSTKATISRPAPAFGDGFDDTPCPALDPTEVQDFANEDISRIQGNIAKALARKAPFTDVLAGGTLASGVSTEVRSIVQERAVLNQSLIRPEFLPDRDMCGEVGEAAEVGSTEYTYFLATNRGMGPLVCVKGMRDAFEGSYLAAEDALKKQIIQLTNADVRATLVDRSGTKLVVKSGATFSDMYSGDSQQVDTPFTTDVGLPDAPINFKLLEYLSIFQRENLLVEGFEGNQSEPLLKFLGSQEIISRLRDEAGVATNHQYLAAGSYQIGKDQLVRYTWEGPYRGYAFGIDPQPLRFSEVDDDGQPVFLEPEVARNTSKGVAARVNPAWARARFEIALVIGADSFARLTPAQYTGEGSFRFPSQVSNGELMFQVIKDNCKNVWGDFGRHFYQISRAYKPMRPHAVTAIAFKRAVADFGLSPVDDFADYSSADSL